MNSVHEPGPNGDSETPSTRKTRSKTKPVAQAPQLAQPAHQARPSACERGRVVASPASYRGRAARPYRSLRLPCRGAPVPCHRHSAACPVRASCLPLLPHARASALSHNTRAPQRLLHAQPSAQPNAHRAVSQRSMAVSWPSAARAPCRVVA